MCRLNFSSSSGVPSSRRLEGKDNQSASQLGTKSILDVPLVADGVEDLNFVKNGSIVQCNSQGVSDGSGFWVVIVGREEVVFNAFHLYVVFVSGAKSG